MVGNRISSSPTDETEAGPDERRGSGREEVPEEKVLVFLSRVPEVDIRFVAADRDGACRLDDDGLEPRWGSCALKSAAPLLSQSKSW